MEFIESQSWYPLIEEKSTRRPFKANEAILFQGEPSKSIGLILSGRAKAVSYSENGDQTWLSYFDPGEFLGHLSLLSKSPIAYEVTAETDMTILMISVTTMENLLTQNIELNQVIAKDMATRLNNMIRRLVDAYTLSARGRVCAELARLSAPIGIEPGRHIIKPNPIFVELALRVNSTRETVSRTVSDLQKKGIISRAPGALIIEKPDTLKDAMHQ